MDVLVPAMAGLLDLQASLRLSLANSLVGPGSGGASIESAFDGSLMASTQSRIPKAFELRSSDISV